MIDPVAVKDEKIRLESEIESLHRNVLALEKVIDETWNKAKETKSPADEQVLAQRINTLSIRKNATLKKISSKESRLHTVEEFDNKIEERKEKRSLAPLTKGSELELQEFLNQISEFEEGKKQTDKILSGISDSDTVEMDDGVAEVLQAIKATKISDTYKIAPDTEQVAPKKKSPEFEN
ncbi:hypothetical protein [Methanoregula sp.]|uniref:hypothetical protein n=1 Tax=Methanoregula sp. TaxID=2052170 RepID=UPI003C275DA6